MDVQLQELIDKIKSEGIKSAEKESKKIIREAQQKANEIIASAHDEASATHGTWASMRSIAR